MNWRDVFDGEKLKGRHISDAALAAYEQGYRFLAFNGEIYFLLRQEEIRKPGVHLSHYLTGLTTEGLQ